MMEEENLDLWDPMKEDYESAKNTLADDSNREALDGGFKPIDRKDLTKGTQICERFAKYGECCDGEYCSRLHITASARDRLAMQNEAYKTVKTRSLMLSSHLLPLELKPDPKALILVAVTDTKKPTYFHVIAPYDTMNFAMQTQDEIDFYIQRATQSSSVKSKLNQCHDALAKIFDRPYRFDNVDEDLFPDQVVACKVNGKYRRALVIGVPDRANDEFDYKLRLIDFGTDIELPREAIYVFFTQILSEIPPMAISCRLDLKPANGELKWSQEALDFFSTASKKQKFLLCRVIDYIAMDDIYEVDLISIQPRSSLTETMIKRGYATRTSIQATSSK